jgi:HK97 gp10 family phage protein
MSTINITIKNLPQIKHAFNKAPALMTKALNKAIRKTVVNIQKEEVENVGGQRGIRIVSGGLKSAAQRGVYYRTLYGEVGANVTGSGGVPYAAYVHDGTKYMKPRPFLLQAVDRQSGDTDKFFTEAVDSVLSDIGRQV